ncbi:uncharacterized protein [Pseudorasbora parva]|uniref:uncharacterized protein n=1 Tax=Pseudorasbora parva TaxID=51549 RepID=UPI00351DD9B0
MLEQYCVRELAMIKPIEICLNKQENEKIISFQYIPLLALLQKLAKNKDVWATLNKAQSANDEILTDFTDGEMFKSNRHMTFHSLRLHFYVDEFEVVNPLGSKRGRHKLTAVYFKLGNLDHKDTSKIQNIYLSTLVHHRFLKNDLTSYDEVLQPLITDLAVLETTGLMLSCEGESRLFNGTVASVSADNLSAHAVAGLTRSFSSGRVCRFCLANAKDIKTKFTEEEFTMRNAGNYRYHLDAVEEDSANSSVYGITNACCFSKLEHVPSPIIHLFPPDIMHDFYEGIIPMVLSLSISQWLKEKYFALSDLNYEIEHFPYGKNDVLSKPVPLSDRALKSCRLGGSATENLTLFRLLPFMIAEQIPETDCLWRLYLLLREIVDIVIAPVIRRSWIPYLSEKIVEFLSTFHQHFPGKITPKMHYMIHYPRLILSYGPLVHLSCLRFEAKHQYFKRVARVLGNFKNITKTLARRHQFRQCWEQSDTDCIGITAETADTRNIPLQALPVDAREALMSQTTSLPGTVSKTTYIYVNSVAYHMGDCIVVNTAHAEEIPVFMEIRGIYCVNQTWLLCGKMLIPSYFDNHFNSYVVEETCQWTVVKPGEEIGHHCLDGYRKSDGQISIPLRHWITNTK